MGRNANRARKRVNAAMRSRGRKRRINTPVWVTGHNATINYGTWEYNSKIEDKITMAVDFETMSAPPIIAIVFPENDPVVLGMDEFMRMSRENWEALIRCRRPNT